MCLRLLAAGCAICLASTTVAFAQNTTSPAAPASSAELAPVENARYNSSENTRVGVNTEFLEKNIDRAMAEAIADGDLPGGVVLVRRFQPSGFDGKYQYGSPVTVFEKAYGNRSVEPTTETTTLDTIYDMASLTKSIATATSIMQLVEQGKIRLTDSVSKYIPEWKNTPEEDHQKNLLRKLRHAINEGKIRRGAGMSVSSNSETRQLLSDAYKAFPDLQSSVEVGNDFNLLPRDRESITIRHLLTHTSGLPPYVRFYEKYPEGHARKKIVADIAQIDLRGPVGGQFIYSDLGFITLGDIVERVSGLPLDEYAQKNIFEPLNMTDTGFNPPESKWGRVAPTEWRGTTRAISDDSDEETTRAIIRGKVHDGNAFAQDGVSGHAGLFSTAADVAKFCDMLLRGGRGSDPSVQILSPATINTMTHDMARLGEGEEKRGLGWDILSAYDSEKGEIFQTGFGHTGFTGTSIWIVPEEKLEIIILTNHVHPDGKGSVVGLRARIADIVAGSMVTSYQSDWQ